jgi:subtilisin-like proprotein convertase family protein
VVAELDTDHPDVADLRRTYDALDVPELAGLAGKSAQGSWTLEVRDEAPEDTGRIVGFGLELVFE